MDEFDVIQRYFAPLTANAAGAFALADDAAVLDLPPGRQLVLTTDAMVAGVHFFPDDPAARVAQKLLRINLSDLAAMGAVPLGYLLTCVYNRDVDEAWIQAFAAGLAQDQEEYFLTLLGGDTVMTDGPATFSLTALGTVAVGRAWRRNGARAGDRVFVTGTIGDSALGLALRNSEFDAVTENAIGGEAVDFLLDRYQLPRPRLGLGGLLQGLLSAASDISDGLVADLGHICAQSGLAAEIFLSDIPLSPAAQRLLAAVPALASKILTGKILTGGDDYELILAGSDERSIEMVAGRNSIAITPIGRFVDGSGVKVFGPEGRLIDIANPGYRHF